MPEKLIIRPGERYGRLVVVSESESVNQCRRMLCHCDCGGSSVVRLPDMRSGKQVSCGCQRRESLKVAHTSHGMTKHPAHGQWCAMKTRCGNPNATQYKDWGGRGITICPEWADSFDAFWADMGATWRKGLSIDRIDVNGNYEPGNCRWSDAKTQARNTRNNVRINTPWGHITVAEAAERSGIGDATLRMRIKAGWPSSQLFNPKHGNTKILQNFNTIR